MLIFYDYCNIRLRVRKWALSGLKLRDKLKVGKKVGFSRKVRGQRKKFGFVQLNPEAFVI